MYKLVIADDEGKTTVVPLVRDEITIGRKEGNTIRLTERNISRRHAKLRKANGSYVVEDLSSYNGVKVNGRRTGGEIALKAGDQIVIGDYQLALQLEDGATLPDGTAPMSIPAGGHANGAEPATAMMQAPAAIPAAPTIPMQSGVASAMGAVAPVPPARLVMTSPPAPGAEFALSRPVTRLGRAEELDIWVNHRSISREHAEITNDGGAIRIRDLGSANGVRINGRDVQQAELKPGDVVELGQVRFRFVAPGETFVFEADRTMQLDAVSAPERSGSRAPLLAAAGIVGVAVIGAVVVALSGGGATTQPSLTPLSTTGPTVAVSPTATPVVPAPAPVAPAGATLDQQVAEAIGACRTAITGGDYLTAIARADQALQLRPGDAQASACREEAEGARVESEAFARGESLRRSGDVRGAYVAFAALPPESSWAQRPEVLDTNRQFAELEIQRANELAASNPDEALSAAQNASLVPGLDARTRREVQALISRLTAAARRAGAGPALSARDRGPGGTAPTRDRGAGGTTGGAASGAGPGTGGGGATTTVRPPPDTGSATSAGSSSETPMQAAQACLAGGNPNPCIVRALEGRARTPQEMRLLIETYRAMGNTPRMLDSMERFVQRFPSDPRAGQYRQILAQQGR